MAQNLGLDEALVSVNKSAISTALEVYYQIDECFGCPLDKLKSLEKQFDSFVIGTKFNLQLELRKANATSGVCKFDKLVLNSHGHYKIDLGESTNGTLNCTMQTLDKGDCLSCPFAILICLLFAITAIEKIYTKFWATKRRRKLQNKSTDETDSNGSGTTGEALEVQNPSNNDNNPVENQQNIDQSRSGCTIWTRDMSSRRIEALDAFRGLTIAGMIFVNYGGAGYAIFEHKPWNGITLADFVFPFFIFAMGASIALSTKSMVKRQQKTFQQVILKIFRRSTILALLGLCLNSKWLDYEHDNLNSLRLTGVLQRFSISYLVVALMYTIELTVDKWVKGQSLSHVPFISKSIGAVFELLTAANYTAMYVFVTFYLEYDSNCPAGYTGPGGLTEDGRYYNCTGGAAAWLDRQVLGENHLYRDKTIKQIFHTQVSHDPEGILGYTTSILLTLIGLQCGKILSKRQQNHKQRLISLIQWSILALPCILIPIIPINKRLWSLTFVTSTGLAALIVVILLYLLLDVYSFEKTFLLRLLISAGKNSIFLYVGHSLLSGMLPWWFPIDETSHLQLLTRLTWSTFVWLLVAYYMGTKQLFIKI